MSKNKNNSNPSESVIKKEKDDNQKGYPSYDESKDIYEKSEKKSEINPEDISKNKALNSTNAVRRKALDKKHKLTGKDLDVPGSELDDAQEAIGSEDEENNYYSQVDDNHEDLKQDKGVQIDKEYPQYVVQNDKNEHFAGDKEKYLRN